MAVFKRINVYLWPEDGWRIQWFLKVGEGFSFNDHIIEVDRSSGPEGPFKMIGSVPSNSIIYEDRTRVKRSFWDRIYYRLRVVNTVTQAVVEQSVPATLGAIPDVTAREIIRQHNLLLYGANTQPGYYATDFACFKRTKQGTKCHYCVSEETGDIYIDRCDECMGTRYLEGFSNPVKFKARFITSPSITSEITLYGDKEIDTRNIFMSSFPILEPGDILVEKHNDNHWEVVSINTSEPGGVIVSQRAVVNRVQPNNIVNRLHYA